MSFVLDALKISEKKRSKFARPVYAHPPRPFLIRRRRRWLSALSLAGGAVLVFLAWRLLVPAPPLAGTQEVASGSGTDATAQSAVQEPVSAGLQNAEESSAIRSPDQPAEDYGDTAPQADPPIAAGDTAPAATDTGAPEVAAATENLLTVVPADWPALTLQMLYYDPQGGRSFVQVNGSSYRAGEQLDAGPQVQEITRDAVILSHRGQTVLLSMNQ